MGRGEQKETRASVLSRESSGRSGIALPKWITDSDDRIGRLSVLRGMRGSVVHGTADPKAPKDYDFLSVYVADPEYYFSMYSVNPASDQPYQIEEWDFDMFEMRRAVRLLGRGDPNLVGLLHTSAEFFDKVDPAGQRLIQMRDIFTTKRLTSALLGHAASALKEVGRGASREYKDPVRMEQSQRLGYDPKNVAHFMRMAIMCEEVLDHGRLQMSRNDADYLTALKTGEEVVDRDDFVELGELAMKELHGRADKSDLPERVSDDELNAISSELVVLTLRERGQLV